MFVRIRALAKRKWVWAIVLLIVIILGWVFTHRGGPTYQFVSVTRGPITETVSATGNTEPISSVSLGFQSGGTIARVNYQLGDTVKAGDVIAELDTASLQATLVEAEATVDQQKANLANLQAGTQPQELSQSESALIAQLNAAYVASDNAVHTTADEYILNPRTQTPSFEFQTSTSTFAGQVLQERVQVEQALSQWKSELSDVSAAESPAELVAEANASAAHLAKVATFLSDLTTVLGNVAIISGVSGTEISSYQADVSGARTSVANATASLASAAGDLSVKAAGSTPEAIAAQEAQVEQAEAGVASAEASLQNAELVAPISGTLTQMDAKVGQSAAAGTPLVAIIGTGGFEVDTGVSDTDVGKLAMGDTATVTLDAFPGETFPAHVFYIAPAETNSGGVVSYLVKLSFDTPDSRFKSGLSATADIETKSVGDALILPQYAILQNDQGLFVETLLKNGTTTTTPVTLGITDENGNVQVLSGVTEGEQVISVGLKTP
ncbi:MAG: efflux RND transporter periplasmic adaptor subunit [Minisyncoccia bacterium]